MKLHPVRVVTAVAAIGVLTACSPSAPPPTPSPSVTSDPVAEPTATTLDVKKGDSASVIASAVSGCSDVRAVPVSPEAQGIASAAHCTLLGQSVSFYAYRQAGGSRQMKDDFMSGASGSEAYFVDGSFWAARVDWAPGAKPDIAGQKAAMEAIETAIPSALVVHVH